MHGRKPQKKGVRFNVQAKRKGRFWKWLLDELSNDVDYIDNFCRVIAEEGDLTEQQYIND